MRRTFRLNFKKGPTGRGRGTNYVSNVLIAEGTLDVRACPAYFCGPPDMINAGIEILVMPFTIGCAARWEGHASSASRMG